MVCECTNVCAYACDVPGNTCRRASMQLLSMGNVSQLPLRMQSVILLTRKAFVD